MNALSAMIKAIILAVILLAVIMTFGIVNVHPTEVGVAVNKVAGKIDVKPLGVGYHLFNRWGTDVTKYIVSARAFPPDTRKNEDSDKYNLDLKTNDGQNISVDLTIIYSLRESEVPLLHCKIGHNYEDQILLPQIRSEARIVVGSYSAEEIYQGKVRSDIQAAIKAKLTETTSSYPAICIHDALMRHFAFSKEFEAAIERKKLAAQEIEINKNRAMAQIQEAKRQEAEAGGMKLRAIQDAEGKAKSMTINADAERYKLEQEAAGNLARYRADAEGKRLQAEALGGGQNVVALKFAEMIPDKLQIYAYPVGQQSTSIMDVSGLFGKMLEAKK